MDLDEETKQLNQMSNELESSQKNAANELKRKETSVKHTSQEWQAVNAAHAGLTSIYHIKQEHMTLDDEESKNINQFTSDLEIFR